MIHYLYFHQFLINFMCFLIVDQSNLQEQDLIHSRLSFNYMDRFIFFSFQKWILYCFLRIIWQPAICQIFLGGINVPSCHFSFCLFCLTSGILLKILENKRIHSNCTDEWLNLYLEDNVQKDKHPTNDSATNNKFILNKVFKHCKIHILMNWFYCNHYIKQFCHVCCRKSPIVNKS